MTLRQHAKAVAALLAIALNLILWCVPLLLLLPVKLLVPSARRWVARRAADVYRAAVAVDDWWLGNVSGASWQRPALELAPQEPLPKGSASCPSPSRPFTPPHFAARAAKSDRLLGADETCIVIANHASWADIFVLQSVVSRTGPILKFLCKRELAWIPVLGLIFVAFDFPMLRRRAGGRGSEEDRRGQDIERIREACASLATAPAAMLAFVEGTRFREAKRDPASGLERLLPPRTGGFAAILTALEPLAVTVVDVSIVYPEPRPTPLFWHFLAGTVGPVGVVVQSTPAHVIAAEGAKPWLTRRWAEKDALLLSTAKRSAGELR